MLTESWIDVHESLIAAGFCSRWRRGCPVAAHRRIMYDTVDKYVLLRQQKECAIASRTAQAWEHALLYSNSVSSVMTAIGDDTSKGLTAEELQVARERALWELLALFWLDGSGNDGIGGQELAGWLSGNTVAVAGSLVASPLPPQLLSQLQEAALPEAHDRFWPTLHRLTAVGQMAAAVELLGLHSAWLGWEGSDTGGAPSTSVEVEVLEAATLLLKRFPTLHTSSSGRSLGVAREFDTIQECLTYRQAVMHQVELWLPHCAIV